jgi:molybdenum cofactor cytidylyltransferase
VATVTGRARVAGIILAAGESKRLGRPKQLLDICDEPMIRWVTRIALAADLDSVTLVLGSAADRIQPLLAKLDVAVVKNPDFASGQASSMRAGLAAIPPEARAALFLLGDQPTIDAGMIDKVVSAYRASSAPIVQSRFAGGAIGHPVLFDCSLFPELMAVGGDVGGRTVAQAHAELVHYVDFDCEQPPDIDTEADYRAVTDQIGAGQAK